MHTSKQLRGYYEKLIKMRPVFPIFRPGALGAVALCCLCTAACTVGPDYRAPEVHAPRRFLAQDVLALLNEGKKDQMVAADWWKGFHDSTLDRLVEQGLENNCEIASAAARIKEARARLKRAGAGDNLIAAADLDGTVEEQRLLNRDEDTTTTGQLFGTLSAALPLDFFGRTRRDIEAARAGLESAEAELNRIVLAVSSRITGEYLRLRGNQRQLELLRESVDLQEKTRSIVRSRYEAGLSPELDLKRAETSVENLRADIPPLEESLLNSRNRLAVLTGRFPGEYEKLLKEKHTIPVYVDSIPVRIPLDVLKILPDIRQAEARLKEQIAAIGVAEAEYYPAFQLSSRISIGASGISSEPSTDVLISSLGALIEQFIIDGGKRRADVEIARAGAEEALADYRQALLDACEDVETVLAAIQGSCERQNSLKKAVQSSRRSFFQAETLYQQGLISFLDVVDAQRVLAGAEQKLAAESTHYATQIAVLFRVLGTQM